MPPLSGGSLRKIKEHAVDKRQDGQCGGLRCPDSAHPTSYISIYISTHLDTLLVEGGGVWSECVVLVQGDHWRCVHLFPCRSMTHTSPSPSPPLFSVYILHCVHMSSHQTPAHWREIRSDHYILILPHTYAHGSRYTLPCLGHVPDIL